MNKAPWSSKLENFWTKNFCSDLFGFQTAGIGIQRRESVEQMPAFQQKEYADEFSKGR